MPAYYIDLNDQLYVRFNGPATKYTDGVRSSCGILAAPPTGKARGRGSVMLYSVVRLRARLADGKSVLLLCDSDASGTAYTSLVTRPCNGSTITDVSPVRRRILI